MAAISQGSTRYNLSKEYFDDYIVIIPHTKKEQQDIARVLTDMSDEINELQAERDKYQMVRDGMMQELLTGRIRLI